MKGMTAIRIFVLCSCIIISLPVPHCSQAQRKYRSSWQVTTPASPPDSLLLLYQIDRDIRSYSYEDVNNILSYEDDTLPYAVAEKLEQNNEHNIKVIKENLKKVKGYLEREREKKKPKYDHILKGVGILLPLMLALATIYCLCIRFKTKVSQCLII